MENEKSVFEVMHRHHAKINSLLASLENELKNKDNEKIKVAFLEFKSNLEKHFSAEENYIFRFCEKINDGRLEISIDLMQEHRIMINMLKGFEKDIKNGRDIDISDFIKIQEEHVNTEEITFYPDLDIILSKEEKDSMLNSIPEL